jgi:hypothetical protein
MIVRHMKAVVVQFPPSHGLAVCLLELTCEALFDTASE